MIAQDFPTIDTEAQRRGSLLRDLQLMDASPDPEFEELLSLAATICGKTMGTVTLLDETTLLIKAQLGLDAPPTVPIGRSLCQYTVRGTSLLMVEDLFTDNRFGQSMAWREETGIRFYAGMPLFSDSGLALGALCVMDTQPATLTPEQQRALQILGRQVSHLIQMRIHTRVMEHMVEERDRAQKMFETVLNHVPVSIYLKDSHGRFRFYNQSMADRFHVDREAWIGKTNFDLWRPDAAKEMDLVERAVLQSGVASESFITVPAPDGTDSHWKSHKVPCLNGYGETMLACCSIDLTEQMRREVELQSMRDELQEANGKLSSLALTDALTGLWNRRAFDARLETGIIAAHRSRQPMTLMLIDVDHFKGVNDKFGHPYGDCVLREIAIILNRVKRAEDVSCRFGGEEFAILLPSTGVPAAGNLANRLLNATRHHSWPKVPVTVSIGIAMCTDKDSSDDLLNNADAALYQAKREGRDRAVTFGKNA